jgi:hypothetical protein
LRRSESTSGASLICAAVESVIGDKRVAACFSLNPARRIVDAAIGCKAATIAIQKRGIWLLDPVLALARATRTLAPLRSSLFPLRTTAE